MTTPALVEYLMALERPGSGRWTGSRLVGRGFQQIHVLYLAAGTGGSVSVTPPPGRFMAIGFRALFGYFPPNALDADVMQYGEPVYSGRLSPDVLRDGIDHFLPVTEAQPLRFTLTNQDVVPHALQMVYHFLTVANPDDATYIWEVIRRHRQSDLDEQTLRLWEKALGLCPADSHPRGGIHIGGEAP